MVVKNSLFMEKIKASYWQLSVVLLFTLVIGCGGSDLDVAPVEGIVTLDGKPVGQAGIIFQPKLGPVSTGVTDAEGHFRLMTGKVDGALVGEHRIVVSKGGVDANGAAETSNDSLADPSKRRSKPKNTFPMRYSSVSTSGLVETVVGGEKNTIEIQLTSKDTKR